MPAGLGRIVRGGALLLARRKFPAFVSHYVNFRCNLSCSYCGTWKERPKELSTARILATISEFSKAGTLSWNISGGEPLLRKDIGKIASFASSEGMAVSINTNGTLLERRAGELASCDLVSVSLDGGEALHDRIRGKGVYSKAVRGIMRAKELGIKTSIMAVISPYTIREGGLEIRQIISLARDMGIQVAFQPMHGDSYNGLSGEIDYAPLSFSLPGYKRAIEIISEAKRKEPSLIRMSPEYIKKLSSKSPHPCKAGRNFCIIMPDGRIAPCFVKEKAASLPKAGVRQFNSLKEYPSCFCHFNCYSEWNSILSLSPESAMHYFLNYFPGKPKGAEIRRVG